MFLRLPSPSALSAWQSQDMGPPTNGGGISIPTNDGPIGNSGASNDEAWANGSGRSPRAQGGEPPRRSSRSRSPGVREREGGREPGGNNPGNNLHVSGLSHRVDTRELEQAFAKVGRVKKAQVMYDPHSRDSRGFGFVTMESAEEADAAITALNGTDLMGKNMTVEKARRGRARTPTPGRYYGPPKRSDQRMADERPYDPRPYDSRYARGYDEPRSRRPRYDDDYRGGGGGGGGRDYDRYRDYDRGYDRGGGGGGYERSSRGYDDRRY
ncbi:hypothetical protein EIP91_006279 [Steccherinum ochraceum]|uniref:RRM domain-containing protein n=1 Tax=Steccherinum ochraceum TaxID=92696 RepID=A0A4R0R8P0_9APHY|nr:hypothetical protein EIP91_006279 [Steccherinum ochraceum]